MSIEKINLLPFRRADSFPYEAPGYANSRHEVSGSHQVCNGNGPRADLNQNDSAPHLDLAVRGRVCVAWDGNGCLHCLGEIDEKDVRSYFSTSDERARVASIYGVPVHAVGETGPSVSPPSRFAPRTLW